MIPKIIHYCWFGKGDKPEIFKKCYKSWIKYASDYKIIEWNESNFDININKYCKDAYDAKKWAFVSDFVRLYVLFNYGGIYLDTDCELTNNVDYFLNNKAFSGYESNSSIPTAIMGSEKKHSWIKELLDYYNNKHFIKNDKSFDTTTNVKIITDMVRNKYGLILDNKEKIFSNDVHIYPKEYFCRFDNKVSNYSIHHFNGSWVDKETIKKNKILYNNMYLILSEIVEVISENKQSSFIKNFVNKKIVIWGIGSIGKGIREIFSHNNINVDLIIDKKYNFNSYKGSPVVDNINNVDLNKYDVICITPIKYINEIQKELRIKNYDNKIITVYELLNIEEIIF